MRFSVSAGGALRLLVPMVLLISAASLVANLVEYHTDDHPFTSFDRLLALLDVDGEANLPAWFSGMLLLVIGLLLADVGQRRAAAGLRYARHWKGLALVFVLLSLDELAQIHEMGNALRDAATLGGALYLPWVLIAAPLVVLLGLAYLRFVWRLPPRTRALLVVSGVLYVGGAMGMEVVGAYIWTEGAGYRSLPYLAGVAVEEGLEMAGLVLFLYTVASYQQGHTEPQPGPPAAETAPVLPEQWGDTSASKA